MGRPARYLPSEAMMMVLPRRSNLPGSPGISSRSELGLFVHFRGESDSLAARLVGFCETEPIPELGLFVHFRGESGSLAPAARWAGFCETEPIQELGLFVQIATPLVAASAAFAALPSCSSSGP